jgi:hypothetical protein
MELEYIPIFSINLAMLTLKIPMLLESIGILSKLQLIATENYHANK